MKIKPYVYVATGKSRDVQRDAPTGARCAVHYPELGRTIELWTDEQGRWTIADIPSPCHGGRSVTIARGQVGCLPDREDQV